MIRIVDWQWTGEIKALGHVPSIPGHAEQSRASANGVELKCVARPIYSHKARFANSNIQYSWRITLLNSLVASCANYSLPDSPKLSRQPFSFQIEGGGGSGGVYGTNLIICESDIHNRIFRRTTNTHTHTNRISALSILVPNSNGSFSRKQGLSVPYQSIVS